MRTLHPHRHSLMEEATKMSHKMQKALHLMNIRLEVVVINAITSKTGRAIIEAILEGERNGQRLLQLADPSMKKSKQEIAVALIGHGDEALMHEQNDCFEGYER